MSVVLLLKLRFSPGALRHTSITRLKLKGIWLRLTDAFQPNSSWLLMRLAALW